MCWDIFSKVVCTVVEGIPDVVIRGRYLILTLHTALPDDETDGPIGRWCCPATESQTPIAIMGNHGDSYQRRVQTP